MKTKCASDVYATEALLNDLDLRSELGETNEK